MKELWASGLDNFVPTTEAMERSLLEFGLALLETSLFLPSFVLHVQPFRLVSTICRSLPLVEAISINIYVNRLLASVGNCDGGQDGSIKPYRDVER
jgi:hypothetical protein